MGEKCHDKCSFLKRAIRTPREINLDKSKQKIKHPHDTQEIFLLSKMPNFILSLDKNVLIPTESYSFDLAEHILIITSTTSCVLVRNGMLLLHTVQAFYGDVTAQFIRR